jgi:hypothetical protein
MHICNKPVGLLLLLLAVMVPQLSMARSNSVVPRERQTQVADELLALGMQMEKTAFDCSHFVNYLFEKVGLDYDYEPSPVLYRGADEFRRVYRPAAGDLIVWPGHVGIVVDPEEKTFLSALRTGVKVASYSSSYWRRKGHARFFRYSSPVGETPSREVRNGNDRTLNDSGLE